jgi:hypothetical protein
VKGVRFPLADATLAESPSKRNRINGTLHSSVPWSSIDLENIFIPSPTTQRIYKQLFDSKTSNNFEKENFPANMPLKTLVKQVKEGLTSPEKKMTVEEWINYNANRGEEMAKEQFEYMVQKFEAEGSRALQALEGIECVE